MGAVASRIRRTCRARLGPRSDRTSQRGSFPGHFLDSDCPVLREDLILGGRNISGHAVHVAGSGGVRQRDQVAAPVPGTGKDRNSGRGVSADNGRTPGRLRSPRMVVELRRRGRRVNRKRVERIMRERGIVGIPPAAPPPDQAGPDGRAGAGPDQAGLRRRCTRTPSRG
ncbi:IS3 family transposase [Micromonospora sp. NBC_01699]|uniref:IS3 family transposase n=1 Tax=Micromonospora sp. NBC_01699 TaxID=2975984 RepID=UPI003FA560B7